MPSSKVIYLGIAGTVIALDSASGLQLWATHLDGSSFVNVVLDGEKLYATTNGEIFCINAISGASLWHNKLKGFGYGLCSIAGKTIVPGNLALIAEMEQQAEAASQTANSQQ